jgi:DNA polymerase III subunit beta
MHFNRKQLIAAVTMASKIVSSRVVQPVLACVSLNTERLVATDLDTWYVQELTGVATGTYSTVIIPAKQLLQVLKSRKDDLVLIADACGIVTVDGMQVESHDPRDYPTEPVSITTGSDRKLEADLFNDAIAQTADFAAGYDHSSILGGVHFNGSELCATDGCRLSQVLLESDLDIKATVPALVLSRLVQPLLKADIKANNTILFSAVVDNRLTIEGGNWKVITRLISGEYPRYAERFPVESMQSVSFDKQAMITALNQLKPFLDKRTNLVAIDAENNKLTVADHTATCEIELSHALSAQLDVTLVKWACNFDYLLQAIESIDSGIVQIQFQGHVKPLVFKRGGYKHLLMPVMHKPFVQAQESRTQALRKQAAAD